MAQTALRQLVGLRASLPLTVLSTEFNSLAAGAATAPSGVVSNDSATDELDINAQMFLNVTFPVAPTGSVDVYVVKQDGAGNYEDGSSTGPILPPDGYFGTFPVRAVTTAQKIALQSEKRLPPRDCKFMALNNTNQAMPASGTTMTFDPSSYGSGV